SPSTGFHRHVVSACIRKLLQRLQAEETRGNWVTHREAQESANVSGGLPGAAFVLDWSQREIRPRKASAHRQNCQKMRTTSKDRCPRVRRTLLHSSLSRVRQEAQAALARWQHGS